jgi:hypothetical protein
VLGAERDQAEARGVEHRGCVARIGDAVAGRWRVAVRRSGATPGAAGRGRPRCPPNQGAPKGRCAQINCFPPRDT